MTSVPAKGVMTLTHSRFPLLIVLAGLALVLASTPTSAERKQPVEVIQSEFLDGEPDIPTRALPGFEVPGTTEWASNTGRARSHAEPQGREAERFIVHLIWRVAWAVSL